MIEAILEINTVRINAFIVSPELQQTVAMGGVRRSGSHLYIGDYMVLYEQTGRSGGNTTEIVIGAKNCAELLRFAPKTLGGQYLIVKEKINGEDIIIAKEMRGSHDLSNIKKLSYEISRTSGDVFQQIPPFRNNRNHPAETLHNWLSSLGAMTADHEMVMAVTRGPFSTENVYKHRLDNLFLNEALELESKEDEDMKFTLEICKDPEYATNDFVVIKHLPDGDPILVGRMIMNWTDEGFVCHSLFPRY